MQTSVTERELAPIANSAQQWREEMASRFASVSIPEPELRPIPENDPQPPTPEISSDPDIRQSDQPASERRFRSQRRRAGAGAFGGLPNHTR